MEPLKGQGVSSWVGGLHGQVAWLPATCHDPGTPLLQGADGNQSCAPRSETSDSTAAASEAAAGAAASPTTALSTGRSHSTMNGPHFAQLFVPPATARGQPHDAAAAQVHVSATMTAAHTAHEPQYQKHGQQLAAASRGRDVLAWLMNVVTSVRIIVAHSLPGAGVAPIEGPWEGPRLPYFA